MANGGCSFKHKFKGYFHQESGTKHNSIFRETERTNAFAEVSRNIEKGLCGSQLRTD